MSLRENVYEYNQIRHLGTSMALPYHQFGRLYLAVSYSVYRQLIVYTIIEALVGRIELTMMAGLG